MATEGWVAIGGLAALWFGGRALIRAALFPVRVCPRCKGAGKIMAPGGGRFKDCPKCATTGELR